MRAAGAALPAVEPRAGGPAAAPLRLHVHAQGLAFVTCCAGSSTVFELRRAIERQFAGLAPGAPPLATHALRDASDYLLPDCLFVQDVLAAGDHVFAVLEKELKPAAEADLEHVLARWRYFGNYTLLALSSAIKRQIAAPGPLALGHGAVHVLVEMLASLDPAMVESAAGLLRQVLCPPRGCPSHLGLCASPRDPGYQCAKWVTTLGLHTRNEAVAGHCAAILCACLHHTDTKAAMVRAGAAGVLAHLSRTEAAETRELATRGLLAMKHAERRESAAIADVMQRRPIRASRGADPRETDAEEKAIASLGVEDALAVLEEAEAPQVLRVALDALLRDCDGGDLRRLAAADGLRLVQALRRACELDGLAAPAAGLAADLLVRLVGGAADATAPAMHRAGAFELLLQLVEAEEDAKAEHARWAMTHDDDGEDAGDGPRPTEMGARLRAFCQGSRHQPPLKAVVDGLVRSPCAQARRILADAVLDRARADDGDGNEVAAFVAPLLSAAAQAAQGGARERAELLALAHALGVAAVREGNKARLIQYGAPSFFAGLLAREASGPELHRAAAKALVNLATGAPAHRASVIRCVQDALPPFDAFAGDSIVSMYLEMLFLA